MIGYTLAQQRYPSERQIIVLSLVIICMISARSAAMAFNRYLDRDIDKSNARTSVREIPSGVIQPNNALFFVIGMALIFIIATFFINTLCFSLSPIALFVVLGYSYTKRFTALCHVVLGVGLGLAPIGAYLSLSNQFDVIPVLFGIGVMLWVAGFDIIYALQDEEFDKSNHLQSIPAVLGKANALLTSNVLHIGSAIIMAYAVYYSEVEYTSIGSLSWVAYVLFIVLLVYQHTLVKPNDLSKVNLAFFTTNGIASVIFGTLFIIDLYY